MARKNNDKNATMRFVATTNDTNKPVANDKHKKAVSALKKSLKKTK